MLDRRALTQVVTAPRTTRAYTAAAGNARRGPVPGPRSRLSCTLPGCALHDEEAAAWPSASAGSITARQRRFARPASGPGEGVLVAVGHQPQLTGGALGADPAQRVEVVGPGAEEPAGPGVELTGCDRRDHLDHPLRRRPVGEAAPHRHRSGHLGLHHTRRDIEGPHARAL